MKPNHTRVKTVKKLVKIKRKLDCTRFSMHDFYAVCPVPIDKIKSKDRHREILSWRHVGMAWAALGGVTLHTAGAEFGKVHSSVIHSIDQVLNAIDGYGLSEIRDALKLITNHANGRETVKITMQEIFEFVRRYYDSDLEAQRLSHKIHPILNEFERTE